MIDTISPNDNAILPVLRARFKPDGKHWQDSHHHPPRGKEEINRLIMFHRATFCRCVLILLFSLSIPNVRATVLLLTQHSGQFCKQHRRAHTHTIYGHPLCIGIWVLCVRGKIVAISLHFIFKPFFRLPIEFFRQCIGDSYYFLWMLLLSTDVHLSSFIRVFKIIY